MQPNMSANDPKRTFFLRGHKVKVGGHLTAHLSANLDKLVRAGPNGGVITRDQLVALLRTAISKRPQTERRSPCRLHR